MHKCYICGNNLEETDIKLRDSKNITVLKCEKCALEVLNDFSHIEKGFYEQGKMLKFDVSPKRWFDATKGDNLRRFTHLKNEIKNKKVLDFGCGAGGFVEFASKIADVCGIEKQEAMFNFIKNKNLKVYNDISEIQDEKFDVITMFHVLEHLDNPVDILMKLKKMLSQKGKLIIEVPNTNDALLTLYNSKEFSTYTHWSCHLFGFNDKNLKKLLKNSGFKKIKIKKIQRYNYLNHLGWLIYKKPAQQKELDKYYSIILDFLYTAFLKLINKTDTITAICEI